VSRKGISRNIGREGKTYQNVADACVAMICGSGFSSQSHIIPRTDTSGSEAISAPKRGYKRATLEIVAIRAAERNSFIRKNNICPRKLPGKCVATL